MVWKGAESGDAMSAKELLWERTPARSKGTYAPADVDAQLPPMRVTEDDFIELHEGAEGQHVLLRRGLGLTAEKYMGSRNLAELDWPSFDDDA
jgi:hypothetical protein